MKLKDACSLGGKLWQTDNILKSRDITLQTKVCIVKAMIFSSSLIRMWELDDHKESWMPKNWCFQIVVLEKTLESPLDCKEVKSVNTKGNEPWIFIGRTVAEAEAPILWPPDVKGRLIREESDVGKDWRQKEEVAEDEMARYHHWLNGNEFEQTPEDSVHLSVHDSVQKKLVCMFMGLQRAGCDLVTEELFN